MESIPQVQYQHFIPKFVLKNFAHTYKPAGPRPRARKKGSENNNHGGGPRRGELVARNIDLTREDPIICESPISRLLGDINMYDDATKPSLAEQRRLEELLGRFENQAARIFAKITKAYGEHQERMQREGGQPSLDENGSVCLTRSERDCIRKFLFILFYRSRQLRCRFDHGTAGDYDGVDKEFVREHMQEKGYRRPLNVWFDNLKAIIDIDMDLEGKWNDELPKRMYPDDALWFINHTEMYYMSICTPDNPEQEFILTDNSYGVFEGPINFTRDQETGEVEESVHCPLHLFAPISPKLMIVLRFFMLPTPLEDDDEEIKKSREEMRRDYLDRFFGADLLSRTRLSELPVAKARNNYSQMVDGRLVPLPGYDGKRKKEHRFDFAFFPINSWHVNSINALLLDNLDQSTRVVFDSTASLAKTLEWYLAAPCHVAGKVLTGMQDGREECLRKLEAVSRSLGSTKKTVTGRLKVPLEAQGDGNLKKNFEGSRRMWKKLAVDEDKDVRAFVERMEKPEGGSFLSYTALGGGPHTVDEDVDQARRMWALRVRIDKFSGACGVHESIRQRNRDLLEAEYRCLPAHRFIIYAKFWRCGAIQHFANTHPRRTKRPPPEISLSGPEDAIAQVQSIISTDRLNRLLYNVIAVDIKRREPESLLSDIWEPLNPWDPISFLKCAALTTIINELGFIRDCGIKEVEDLACQAQVDILKRDLHNQETMGTELTVLDLLEAGERIELLTRFRVRERFAAALAARIRPEPLKRLKEALFEFAYPTPPVWLR